MVIRQLKESQYERLRSALLAKARVDPLDASCTVRIDIDGVEYAVKLQPEPHRKMAVLQALRIYRDTSAPHFDLITDGGLLSSLLELLVCQGVRQG